MGEILGGDMQWPHCKGSVVPSNVWNAKLDEFMEILNSVQSDAWWISDTGLKYLTIRVDTRDNAFILTADGKRDGERVRIDPQRVVNAIEKYKSDFLTQKERSK